MSNGAKKGLHPLAWVGIGCAGLLLVGFVVALIGGAFVVKKGKDFVEEIEANPAKVTAEMAVRINPDLDLVESNEAAGTMTIRNKKTNEVITVDYEAIKEGRLEWTKDNGETGSVAIAASETSEGGAQLQISTAEGDTKFGGSVDLSDVPTWVPAYPNALDRKGTFTSETPDGIAGAYSFTSPDKPKAIVEYYEKLLTGQGFEVSKQIFSANGSDGGTITGARENDNRTVTVVVQGNTSGTQGTLQYSEAKK